MSMPGSPAAYREMSVLGSSPQKLVPVMYEHLLINVKRGMACVRQGDIEGKFDSLARASDIVGELLASLDHEAGGELSQRLGGLYTYWLREIAIAGRDLDVARLERIAEMVGSLLEAWTEAARLVEADQPAPSYADGTA